MGDPTKQSIAETDRMAATWHRSRDDQFIERGWAMGLEKYGDEKFFDQQNVRFKGEQR